MTSDYYATEPVAMQLAAVLHEVSEVLRGCPPISETTARGGAAGRTTASRTAGRGHSPSLALAEIVGRTNITYGRLAMAFDASPNGSLTPRTSRSRLQALHQADARRYICALTLMVFQLVTIDGNTFSGMPLRQLREECRRHGEPDRYRNLSRELGGKPGFVVRRHKEGWVAYLEPRFDEAPYADLSHAAQRLCAEAVDELLI